jgi:hypothetical protein
MILGAVAMILAVESDLQQAPFLDEAADVLLLQGAEFLRDLRQGFILGVMSIPPPYKRETPTGRAASSTDDLCALPRWPTACLAHNSKRRFRGSVHRSSGACLRDTLRTLPECRVTHDQCNGDRVEIGLCGDSTCARHDCTSLSSRYFSRSASRTMTRRPT